MPKIATGTASDQSIMFATGVLTINSKYNLDVTDVTINQALTLKELRSLGSLKPRQLMRTTLTESLSCTVKGGWSEISQYFFSSSSAVSGGTQYSVLDGQQTSATIFLTVTVANNAGTISGTYQYQLVNPIITKNNVSLKTDDYGETAIDIACTEIVLVVDSGAENL